jgi:zinc transporter ZupT
MGFIVSCVFVYGGINACRANSISMYGHLVEFEGVSTAIIAAVLVACSMPLFSVVAIVIVWIFNNWFLPRGMAVLLIIVVKSHLVYD